MNERELKSKENPKKVLQYKRMAILPERIKIDQLKLDQSPWLFGQKVQLMNDENAIYRFIRDKNGVFEFISDKLFIHRLNKYKYNAFRGQDEENQLLKEEINSFKLKTGCSKCGYKEHPKALHFDHIDSGNKKKGVSDLMASFARAGKRRRPFLRKIIFLEMAKCVILCANCHSIKTSVNKCGVEKLKRNYSSGEEYMNKNGRDDKIYLLINPDNL